MGCVEPGPSKNRGRAVVGTTPDCYRARGRGNDREKRGTRTRYPPLRIAIRDGGLDVVRRAA
jgi:hypothetical protein